MQKKFELGRMDIVDLYGWKKSEKIVTGPYFQRNSVWKEKDRVEFIDTIMKGYPIPSIFICEGEMDLDNLVNTYYVLDGKQRLESIFKFLNNEYKYDNKNFKDFSSEEKSDFLSFSIPIIQIYMTKEEKEDPDKSKNIILEIFKRLNKNSYNLNKIEKQTSQYGEYDFMKLCKIICNFISLKEEEELEDDSSEQSENDEIEILTREEIPQYVKVLSSGKENITRLFSGDKFNGINLFTEFQKSRQVNIQHLLNIIVSIDQGIINRNSNFSKIIEYSEETILNNKIKNILEKLDKAAYILRKIYEHESLNKWWISKTNLYTLILVIYKTETLNEDKIESIITTLNKFKDMQPEFEEYKNLCQNSVNDTSVRTSREKIIVDLLKDI